MDKRKEFTQTLVSNLKSKITEFKDKKNKDRAERKNELDFEINKDLVNKFKKNHQSSLHDNANNQNANQVLNGSFTKETNTNNLIYNIKGNYDSEIQPTPSKDNNNINLLNNIIKSNVPNSTSSLNKQNIIPNIHSNSTKTTFSLPKQNIEQNTKISLNKSRDHINVDNTTSSQQNIQSKKIDIMKSLLNNNKTIPKKNSFSYASSIPINKQNPLYNYNTNPPSTKEKIQKFVYNLDDNKGSLQQRALEAKQKIPKYTFNTFADTKYEPSLKERNVYVSNKYNLKNNDNELNDFADFSLKRNRNDSSSTKQRTFSSDNLTFKNELPQKKNSKQFGNITQNEIRALAGKIRFLSNEDIRLMDKNVIEELLSLSNVIKRTFENK